MGSHGRQWQPCWLPTDATEELSYFALPAVVRRIVRKVSEIANTAANGGPFVTGIELIYRICHNSAPDVI